ncbi:MAG: 2-hydroxyacyl-CoA dehydratase [Clostridia bacterium]|nr:2-hydroxyacyl-CoA dehydratase [Clostridia bacterium]
MREKSKQSKLNSEVLYDENGDRIFTLENKKDYTLLVPSMIPLHFRLIKNMLEKIGYKVQMLDERTSSIAETGLKYVHNDTCYPATLVIGQFIEVLQSNKYDNQKVALVISQTGGGCRASNYLYLLKKALKKAGFGYVPVLSFNLSGLKTQPGFKLKVADYLNLLKCVMYGDLLMLLKNQCEPYEVVEGETIKTVNFWIEVLNGEFANSKNLKYGHIKKNFALIIDSFAKIERNIVPKAKVGIVGEIFVKYSPLANNDLEKFLVKEGAEVYVPGLTDFVLYSAYNNVVDAKLYGEKKVVAFVSNILYKNILKKQKDIIKLIEKQGSFNPPTSFDLTIKAREGYINEGMKMGEGWLLTSEMIELIESGINNIICAQPFGCLPNHIAGKGMMKIIKEKNPKANIVAIDYDASASRINQENRIKLMLSNARENLE